MSIITEVCADNLNSAITADRAGADRIELCQGLSEGGLTPSPALIRWCTSNLKLGVMVLIRPRGGDFLYNDQILKLKSAPKLDKEICRIDWGKTNLEIWNLVRGLSPSPAAYTEFLSNNKSTQIKILTAEITTSEEQASPGRVIKESKSSLIIKCGSGFLRILELQPAGKRRMKASEFLAGIKDPDKCLMK